MKDWLKPGKIYRYDAEQGLTLIDNETINQIKDKLTLDTVLTESSINMYFRDRDGDLVPIENKLGTNPKDLIGSDKVPLSRVPAVSIFHEGMAMGNGGDKYGPYNWRDNAVQADIYIDACLRHIHLWFDSREENALDSGVHHLGHAKACLGILLDAQATGNLIDNRPKDGKSNVVLEQLNETRKKQRTEIKEKN